MHSIVPSALTFGGRPPRFSVLPALRKHFILMRLASTASAGNAGENKSTEMTEYPFPEHAHPTPYEIFHLKPGSPPGAIKARYYQLVRIHHPDTSHARRLPAHVSHVRFQAIQAAHELLTSKARRRDFPSSSSYSASPEYGNRSYAHRRPPYLHNFHAEWAYAAEEAEQHADDGWKDQTIMLAGIAAIGFAVVPFLTASAVSKRKHMTAAQNLAQARQEAREVGMSRRAEIRKRVRGLELEREYEDRVLLVRDRHNDPPPG